MEYGLPIDMTSPGRLFLCSMSCLLLSPLVCGQIILSGVDPFQQFMAPVETPPSSGGRFARPLPAETPIHTGKTGRLHFLNGDRLLADIQEITSDTEVVLTRDDLRAPLHFATRELSSFHLATATLPLADHDTRLQLTNGDRLHGRLLGMNDEHLRLDTTHSGEIRVSRLMVSSIQPLVRRHRFYTWTGEVDDWEIAATSGGAWKLTPTHMAYSGGRATQISREFENLPDDWRMDFTVTTEGNLNLMVPMMAQSAGNSNPAWILTLAGDTVRLQRSQPHNSLEIGRMQVQGLQEKEELHVTVFLNKARKSFSVFIDNEFVNTWTDPHGFDNPGAYMQILGTRSEFRITAFSLSRWNGTLPSPESNTTEKDVMEASNGDRFSGTLLRIEDEKAVFEGELTSFSAPLDRLDLITFQSTSRGTPRKHAADTTLLLRNGDRITLKPEHMDGTHFVGTSESYGDVRMDRMAIREILFNVHDERNASR